MTAATIVEALRIPADARVDQRVTKKLLVENGAPTAADKRQINDDIDELHWLAALKPTTVGVPAYRDDVREYLEIAVLSVALRTDANAAHLTHLIHRAIPYPVFLVRSQAGGLALSLAHLRWSQGQAVHTVLDGLVISATVDETDPLTNDLLASLALTVQPRQHLHALYQGWIELLEAQLASVLTGSFTPLKDASAAERRRAALVEHDRLAREIAGLRARTAKERQLNRRVELNLEVKQLELRLAATINSL